MTELFDVIIVGGGHNGLVAASYLAKAGKKTLLLERLEHTGGAAISAQAFEGIEARLSRYSYLVSLFPQRIIDELGLSITLKRRRYSSYTPVPGTDTGLLIDNGDSDATAASFVAIGAGEDAAAFDTFYSDTAGIARALWPTVTEPLPTESEAKRLVGSDALWSEFFERPLGESIERRFSSDLVRGVVLTDGLIGNFVSAHDASLDVNRCFLYHVIGGTTGDWDVPVGGMGSVTGELWHAAANAGVDIRTSATATAIIPETGTVNYEHDGETHSASASYVLSGVAPWVMENLIAAGTDSAAPADADADAPIVPKPEGAQVKVNLLLKRLPRLKDAAVDPAAAFGGTFHINELYTQLEEAFSQAIAGSVPALIPAEIYCHSLTDPSILSPELQAEGVQTLTVFALHVPDRLVTEENNDALRADLQAAVLKSLNSVLAEPIEDVLMTDANGNPCVETKTTLDIEHALAMPGGNIFHGQLSWPFLPDDAPRDTPAQRWGVDTRFPKLLLCGSGTRRGGAVSGLGGHSAAMAILEELS